MTERDRVLVVGSDDAFVADALRAVRDDAAAAAVPVTVEVLVADADAAAVVRDAVDRVDLGAGVAVTTTVQADDENVLVDRVSERAVDRVFVPPDDDATARAARDAGVPVERVHGRSRARSRRPLLHDRTVGTVAVTFLVSFAFYLLLGDPTSAFDLTTGAATAAVIAVALARVAVDPEPSATQFVVRGLRATVFLPYLLYAVVRANLAVASVILHPSLPVEPTVVEFDPGDRGPFERAVLANAITLTPGTVTVDAGADRFRVHALTAESRAELADGSMARAVSWVFRGRGEP